MSIRGLGLEDVNHYLVYKGLTTKWGKRGNYPERNR